MDSKAPAALPSAPLAVRLRSRAVYWLMRVVDHERMRGWHERGLLRLAEALLLGGDLQILGGLVPRLRLAGPHFAPWGAQALGVLAGTHEVAVQEALRRTLAPGAVFLDVGANIGHLSLLAAHLTGPGGRVVSLDAQAECAAALRANAAANGFDHMTVIHAAATERSGETEVRVVADSLWTRVAGVGEHPLERRRDRVRAVTLDDLVAAGEAPAPDVVKIDVEGGELEVVAGMRELLASARPVVICEMHGRNAEFVSAMRSAGYAVTNLEGTDPVETADGNVIALCEAVPAGGRS